MSREIDLKDTIFGRLKVIGKSDVRKIYTGGQYIRKWKCVCICGNRVLVGGQSLRTGNAQSCGCLQKEKASLAGKATRKEGTASRVMYGACKQAALRRKLSFEITYDNYMALTQTNCVYCGRKPFAKYITKHGDIFTYNGIDRLDNNKGYTLDNSVTCCWDCNRMKGTLTVTEFIEQCKRILKEVGL